MLIHATVDPVRTLCMYVCTTHACVLKCTCIVVVEVFFDKSVVFQCDFFFQLFNLVIHDFELPLHIFDHVLMQHKRKNSHVMQHAGMYAHNAA